MEFNYTKFVKELTSQTEQIVPEDISEYNKKYIVNMVHNFCILASEALCKEENFSEEDITFITQIIGECTFHKSIDLLRAGIDKKLTEKILQNIASWIFEVAKAAVFQKISTPETIMIIDNHVKKVYTDNLTKLKENGSISSDEYDKAMKESNIDTMSLDEKNKIPINKDFVANIKKSDDKSYTCQTQKPLYKKLSGSKIGNDFKDLSSKIIEDIRKRNSGRINVWLWILLFVMLIVLAIRLCFINIYLLIPIILLTACGLYIHYKFIMKQVSKDLESLDNLRQHVHDIFNPDKMYEKLGVDILKFQIGTNLLPIADPEQDGLLLPKIAALRQRLAEESGYVIPNIRIQDSAELGNNSYAIFVRDKKVAQGTVYPGRDMVIAEQWDKTGEPVPKDAVIDINPVFNTKVYWIENYNNFYAYMDLTFFEAIEVIINHFEKCVKKYSDVIIENSDIQKYIKFVKDKNPSLADGLVPEKLSVSDLRIIFSNLIKKDISIKDIIFVFEILNTYSDKITDTDELTKILINELNFDSKER